MSLQKSLSRKIFEVGNAAIMIIIMFICLAPLVHVLFSSISDPAALAKHSGLVLFPVGNITFEGYQRVLSNKNIFIGYMNTLIVLVSGTVLSVCLTSIGAYAFSRKKFMWANPLMLFVSFTMLFNGGLIPTYMVIKNLGWIDNRLALIIPGCISVFNLIIMRTSFMTMPESLEESAKIDGASEMTILFRIIIPLSKAVIAVIILFTAVNHWNSFFQAMIYIQSRDKYPLQLILREIIVQNEIKGTVTSEDFANQADLFKQLVKYCTIIVATLPILAIYPFIQKHFVKGVMIGSIKG